MTVERGVDTVFKILNFFMRHSHIMQFTTEINYILDICALPMWKSPIKSIYAFRMF